MNSYQITQLVQNKFDNHPKSISCWARSLSFFYGSHRVIRGPFQNGLMVYKCKSYYIFIFDWNENLSMYG